VKETGPDITEIDLDRIAGERDVLVGRIQESGGIAQKCRQTVAGWQEANQRDD
jgi:uncharacterized protein YjbJ (UPF0337 family)